jgi:hypothetical protein
MLGLPFLFDWCTDDIQIHFDQGNRGSFQLAFFFFKVVYGRILISRGRQMDQISRKIDKETEVEVRMENDTQVEGDVQNDGECPANGENCQRASLKILGSGWFGSENRDLFYVQGLSCSRTQLQ